MIDTSPFTEAQWLEMCSAEMSMPVPLHLADLERPFVYQRGRGLFYVSSGCHAFAMSVLLAFDNNTVSAFNHAFTLNMQPFDETAEYWLMNTEGTAFLSSVGTTVTAGRPGNLNAIERRFFKKVLYLSQRGRDD